MALFSNISLSQKYLVMLDQAVYSGNSFLATILIAHVFGPTNFGNYAAILLSIFLIISILTSIVIQPLQVSLAGIEDKHTYISFSTWLQLSLIVLFTAIAIIILQLELPILSSFQPYKTGIIILMVGYIFHDYFRKLFLASNKIKQTLTIDIIFATIQILVLILSIFNPPTFENLIILLGLSFIPSILLSLFYIKPNFHNMKLWKEFGYKHYIQSRWLFLTAIVQWWSANLFVVASGLILGVKALGAFRLVQSLFGVLNILLQTFENYALPQAAIKLAQSQISVKQYLRNISSKSIVIFGSTLLIIFIFSQQIIVLAGGDAYAEYAYVVQGMSILYFIIFMGYPIRLAIRVLLLNSNFFIGYLFSLAFSLIAFKFLLENLGLIGVITGLITSQLILISYWQFILIKNNFQLWK
jgi:O-antigen/teichoic acid export membrane protein